MKRRLAAILIGDIVGFSAMMEADEDDTARKLAAWREMIDAEISKCDGRLFKAMGDAVLVEFASPISAVKCAVDIRTRLALTAQSDPRGFRMRFGLHLADVLIDGEDLIGDGVNLAARVQQSAEADSIDISASLFEQIRRNSPYTFEDRGEQSFRNIAEPVRVYRLLGEIDRYRFQVAPTLPKPVTVKRPHSLAVMPFDVAGVDEDQRYLGDGLSEDLIFELGRFKHLFVTSRSAIQALGANAIDPQTAGERLGVRYLLAGTIRRIGKRVRLGLTLSETEGGGVVWSDRVDEPLESLLDRLDEVASRIASTVLGRIEETDMAVARRLRPESMTAYDLHLRGLAHHRLGGVVEENYREAARWFERAIEADESYARPWAMSVCSLAGLPGFDLDDGERRIQRALELDPNEPEANRIMGVIRMYRGDFDSASKHVEKAMAMSPSDAYVRSRASSFYIFAGDSERALRLLDEADQLDPFLPLFCVEERVAALYCLGRFREAIEAAPDDASKPTLAAIPRRRARGARGVGRGARGCRRGCRKRARAVDVVC
jgi:adenylate cyclase